MLDGILEDKAEAFCAFRKITKHECLGCGVHGSVWVVSDKQIPVPWALKLLRRPEFYERERDCYRRLQSRGVFHLLGFNVPQLLAHHDVWHAVEMTIVRPPFVLDFAGAWLDKAPEFSTNAWEMWEAEKQEQFEEDWPEARRVLAALANLGVHMMDVHPGNVMFR
jgi:hypothetical protein